VPDYVPAAALHLQVGVSTMLAGECPAAFLLKDRQQEQPHCCHCQRCYAGCLSGGLGPGGGNPTQHIRQWGAAAGVSSHEWTGGVPTRS